MNRYMLAALLLAFKNPKPFATRIRKAQIYDSRIRIRKTVDVKVQKSFVLDSFILSLNQVSI